MPERDILIEKSENIRRCLRRIREVTKMNPESLDDLNVQDIFVLNLQRAIQACIDIALHIVSSLGCELPGTMKESFEILNKNKIILSEPGDQLKKKIVFRSGEAVLSLK